MTELSITACAFLFTYLLARYSAGLGIVAICWVGAFYGIVRANFFGVVTYFMFDAAVVGIYLALLPTMIAASKRTESVRSWTIVLLVWPLIYLGLGFVFPQHPLVQLVGLRAAIWFVPFIMIGTQLTRQDFKLMAVGIALLNLVTFAFAVAEYALGLDMFYPRNAATELIYKSNDVAEFTAYRIPATFSSSAAYGGYLVAGFPFIITRLASRDAPFGEKVLMLAGLISATMGVFICGARTPVLMLGVLFLVAGISLRRRSEVVLLMAIILAGVIYQVLQDERFQRVSSALDPETTMARMSGGARMELLETISDYPFGVGLGGAYGTSIPSFLAEYQTYQVGAENEFARLALEQSVVALFLWMGFLLWIVYKRWQEPPDLALRLLLTYCLVIWGISFFGTGTLASVPTTAMMLAYMGLCGTNWRPITQRAPAPADKVRAAAPPPRAAVELPV